VGHALGKVSALSGRWLCLTNAFDFAEVFQIGASEIVQLFKFFEKLLGNGDGGGTFWSPCARGWL